MKRLILLVFVCVCFVGCRTIYVPTEIRTERLTNVADTSQMVQLSKLVDQLQSAVRTQEKVVIRDSVVMVVNEQGEVTSREVFHDRDRDFMQSEMLSHVIHTYDSLYQRQSAKIDSVLSMYQHQSEVVVVKPSLMDRLRDVVLAVVIMLIILFALREKITNFAKNKL